MLTTELFTVVRGNGTLSAHGGRMDKVVHLLNGLFSSPAKGDPDVRYSKDET